jgi:tetratricopeptide (TPR) repeat protein
MSSRIGTSIAIALFATAVPQIVIAQSASLAGTWEFHPEKSTATTAPLPKSMKLTFSDAAGSQMTVEGVDAQGKPVKGTIATVADGKPHPVAGMTDFDTATLTRFNDTTTSYNYQKRKATAVLGNRVLSRDGNVLTFREQIFNANGKQTGTTTMVFAKPGFDFASLNQSAPSRATGTTLTSPLTPDEVAASAALEKGEDDAAVAMFTKVIDAKQPTPMLYYDHVGRGIAYAKKNQHEQALADFDAALKLKPGDADALFRRAGTRLQLKQYQAAIDDFSASITVDGTNAMAYRLRGFAYNTLGNDKAAGADYDKACALNKDLCQN